MAQEPGNPGQGPHKFQIFVDGQHFTVSQTAMTGAQIKGLVGKDAQYKLFLEEQGNAPDREIGDNESVTIREGMHFYTVPAASFGSLHGRA